LNPNTGTCPVFRSRRDAEITLGIYRRVPVLVREGVPDGNPWGVSFMRMFDMSNDSHLFRTREELEAGGWGLQGNIFVKGGQRMLPLYEAKMLHHYDHRWATYTEEDGIRDLSREEKRKPNTVVMPRYWVSESGTDVGRKDRGGKPVLGVGVQSRLDSVGWDRGWLLGWRDICRSTDERTAISGIFPKSAVGNNLPVSVLGPGVRFAVAGLVSCVSSMVFDFCARLKVGGTHLNFFITHQLPVISVGEIEPFLKFVNPRVLELAFVEWRMEGFAEDMGDLGGPFRWDEGRRSVIRAELDALFFHLYGI